MNNSVFGKTMENLSKVLMYQFHYQQILVKYEANNARLLAIYRHGQFDVSCDQPIPVC